MRNRIERLAFAEEIDDATLAQLSDTVTSQGIIAAVEVAKPEPIPADGLVLILDAIADPGNAGTMIRTANAAGVVAIIAAASTTDLWAPKAVRAGMGAHFWMPVYVDIGWSEIPALLGHRPIVAAGSEGGLPYWQYDWRQPSALVIGSEAHGLTEEALASATERVTIPMAEEAESLNAAIAAAVLMFEARRHTLETPAE